MILVFLRHHGSPFARETLAALREEHARLAEAGGFAAAVFMGSVRQVSVYAESRPAGIACYADPDRRAFDAFGLGAAGPSHWLLHPRVLVGAVRLAARGIAVGLPHPGQDVRQTAGAFAVSAGGRIRVAHYPEHAADLPRMPVLLEAIGAG